MWFTGQQIQIYQNTFWCSQRIRYSLSLVFTFVCQGKSLIFVVHSVVWARGCELVTVFKIREDLAHVLTVLCLTFLFYLHVCHLFAVVFFKTSRNTFEFGEYSSIAFRRFKAPKRRNDVLALLLLNSKTD